MAAVYTKSIPIMFKFHSYGRPLTLNLVFLVCLAGSILFVAVSEMKAQKTGSCQAMTSSGPSSFQSSQRSSAG